MKKVFIASRFGEEKINKIRKKLFEELININIEPIDLNDNMAISQPPIERSLENVCKSDIVIVLLGDTYGTIPLGYQKSFTHLEYEEALKHKDKIKTYVFGIGNLYQGREIQYSDDINMMNWQKNILNSSTIGIYSEDEGIEAIVNSIIMNIYREENKVWFDEDTGLMWQVQVDAYGEIGGRYHWDKIFKYKDDLNKNLYAGFNDWRIPTIKELKTLLTRIGYSNKEYSYDKETFIKKPLLYSMTMLHARFWSASSNPNDTTKAYGIHFGRRRPDSLGENKGKDKYEKTRYVRCVRLWMNDEIDTAWGKVNQEDIESIQAILHNYPHSKYEDFAKNLIKKLYDEEELRLNNLSFLEKKLNLYKKDRNKTPISTLLFNDIKQDMFNDEKYEALLKLKEIMHEEGSWKELPESTEMPQNPAKKKKYQRTLEIMNLLESYQLTKKEEENE